MNLFTTTSWSTILICILISFSASATTYTSLADGNWNDVTSVWSTDGVTSCGCYPPYNSNGDDVVINHNIVTTGTVEVSGSSAMTISATGDLSGTNNVLVTDGVLTILGTFDVNKLEISFGSTVHAFGPYLGLMGRLVVEGTLNMDNCIISILIGNFEVTTTGVVNTYNGSQLNLSGGNIDNKGTIDLCPDCCFTTLGNWKNWNSGVVTGTGAASTQIGNMQNQGNWGMSVHWCSLGNDTGMPTPEDCGYNGPVCISNILPVELLSFEAVKINDQQSAIRWSTATEYNSDYFVLYKSIDGIEWSEVDRVQASGNSSQVVYYAANDASLHEGNTYYRLAQADLDGTRHNSQVIALQNVLESTDAIVFPNPMKNGEHITISKLNAEMGNIRIYNSVGSQVYQTEKTSSNTSMDITLNNLHPGVYMICIEQDSGNSICKVIISN